MRTRVGIALMGTAIIALGCQQVLGDDFTIEPGGGGQAGGGATANGGAGGIGTGGGGAGATGGGGSGGDGGLGGGGSGGMAPLTWSAPQRLTTVSVTGQKEVSPSLSQDGLSIYYVSDRITPRNAIYVAERLSPSAGFQNGVVALEDSSSNFQSPEIAPSGLEMFLFRSLGILVRSERANLQAPWSPVTDVTPNGDSCWGSPSISGDALTLYFWHCNDNVVYRIHRTTPSSSFGPKEIVNVTGLAALQVNSVGISPDELMMVLGDFEPVASIGSIYLSRRSSTTQPFGPPERIDEISDAGSFLGASFNADATELYFSNVGPSGTDEDLYVSFLD